MKRINRLSNILGICTLVLLLTACKEDKEQLAIVRTTEAVITSKDLLVKQADILIGGSVINDGKANVTERGILFGKTPSPSDKTVLGSGVGSFSTIVKVDSDTVYYYRSYAVNNLGLVYGDLKTIMVVLKKPMYPENFDGDNFPPAGWKMIDHDGDGNEWFSYKFSDGTTMASSRSYQGGALTPYNFLVAPKTLVGSENPVVKWMVQANHKTDFAEHYKVVVSEVPITNANCEDATVVKTLHEETLTQAEYYDWGHRQASLSNYIGKEVYIAWVHYKCKDMSRIYVTNIRVNLAD